MGTYREFFGLKDKDGKEYKLLYGKAIFGNLAIEEITSEPSFKVGQWVYYTNPPNYKGMDAVFRITDIVETSDKGRYRVSNIDGGWYEADRCRPATKEEIESHLRKICDEKYVGKRVRCLHAEEYCGKPQLQIQTPTEFLEYFPFSDQLRYSDATDTWIVVYEQGEFAKIVIDKRKLPKTKDELRILLNEVQDDASLPFPTINIDQLLDQYED